MRDHRTSLNYNFALLYKGKIILPEKSVVIIISACLPVRLFGDDFPFHYYNSFRNKRLLMSRDTNGIHSMRKCLHENVFQDCYELLGWNSTDYSR